MLGLDLVGLLRGVGAAREGWLPRLLGGAAREGRLLLLGGAAVLGRLPRLGGVVRPFPRGGAVRGPREGPVWMGLPGGPLRGGGV